MDFEKVAAARWSVRSFDRKEVESRKIEYILQAVRCAPTAKNMQPVRIFCAGSKDSLEKLNTVSPCIYNAPIVMIVCSDENASWKSPDGDSRGEMDASIAATHIVLAAANEGLGSCWVCMFDKDKLKKQFSFPENIVPRCLIDIGYPTADAQPSERHFDRLPLDETVKFI